MARTPTSESRLVGRPVSLSSILTAPLGQEWLDRFNLPTTPMARTGGGGLHCFFRYPEGAEIKNSAGKIAPEVDIRGDGGYIIVAPSVHVSGCSYEWINSLLDTDLAEAPPALLEAIVRHKETKQKTTVAKGNARGQFSGAEQGGRDDALFRHACSLERLGLTHEEFHSKVMKANQQNRPPLEDCEVEKIIASAGRYFGRAGLVDRLLELPVSNVSGEIFRPDVLDALVNIYRYDTAAWARLKPALSRAHLVRDVTNAIKERIRARTAVPTDPESIITVPAASGDSGSG